MYFQQLILIIFPLIHIPEEYTIINLHLILYHVIAKVKSPLHSHSNELHFCQKQLNFSNKFQVFNNLFKVIYKPRHQISLVGEMIFKNLC